MEKHGQRHSTRNNGRKLLGKLPKPVGGLEPSRDGRNSGIDIKTSSFKDSPVMKVMKEAQQSYDLRKHLIRELENDFGAKIVSFFTSFPSQEAQIQDSDAEMLESVLASEHRGGKLLMIINSPGGQALAAERIVNVCRAYSNDDFEVLVPHMAKSAATMICFGAAVIHMSKTAELGPVDPQVPYWLGEHDPEVPPQWISAEEYIRSYDRLVNSASGGKAKRIEPFLQQLARYDARYVERLRSIQRLSADISVRLLRSLMMKGDTEKRITKAIEPFLSQTRTSSHGRMINLTEAKKCGLIIRTIELNSPTWKRVWELYARTDWAVTRSCNKVIETTETGVQT